MCPTEKDGLLQVALFRPDSNARSKLVNSRTHLQYQVRSSGSQVFVGNRNHRAEPISVLRRAPTLTDEQRQQRVGLRAFSPSELLPQSAKERPRESSGFNLSRSIQLSPGKLDTVFHTVKPWENQQTLYMAPRSVNQDVSLDGG